jgi:ABC-type dipeptide/oligopeptide/nickel transport system permease subunit
MSTRFIMSLAVLLVLAVVSAFVTHFGSPHIAVFLGGLAGYFAGFWDGRRQALVQLNRLYNKQPGPMTSSALS